MADALPEAEGGLGEGVHPENLVDYLDLSMSAGPDGAPAWSCRFCDAPSDKPRSLAGWALEVDKELLERLRREETTVRAAPSTTRPVATSGAVDVDRR